MASFVEIGAAISPLVIVAILLIGFLWPAERAMPVAWVVAGVAAFVIWDMPVDWITAASIRGGLAAIEILWIVFGALVLLYTLMNSGAVDRINEGFASISEDRRVQIVLLAFFVATFIEGVAGFGTPAAVVAPLLLALGFPALAAVIAALIGHAIATVFGAVGTPIIVGYQQPLESVEPEIVAEGMSVAGYSASAAGWAAVFNGLLGILMPLFAVGMITYFFGEQRSLAPIWGVLPLCLFSGAAFAVPYMLTAWFIGPELPSLFAAMVGGAIVVAVLRAGYLEPSDTWTFPPRNEWPEYWVGTIEPGSDETTADGSGSMSLLRAWSPYVVLVIVLIGTRVIEPVADTLQGGPIATVSTPIGDFSFGPIIEWSGILGTELSGAVEWAYVPGTWLLLSALIAIPIFSMNSEDIVDAWREAGSKIISPLIALVFVIAMVEIMLETNAHVQAGVTAAEATPDGSMIVILADATAATIGPAYPMIAPIVGALGAFIAGSITVSNITFSAFQFEVARSLDMPTQILVGAQSVGGAIGNVIAIHNVIAALATVGLVGKTGRVIRLNLIPVAYYLIAGGILATVSVYLFPAVF
ncbi:L-lactate permease [Salinarchaeum sp. IM2453]|uniref:L-lactate permease n=1 Tax=Salinarchaeum sp. IM2453 TaxID=2862870 RepID=UPI001C835D87|nr:L-lactate permease [Salinarchaeum sp. IM2453]QZA88246.1 L-lactate permease [Salinarchaeum sp. IM2453]